ncbi:hypothetical protein UNDYM_0048 [Undibacterium sp. YM2]|jgi:uncharacterized protein (DUF1501 family)|uniref:DUF1501 domain-containing protein n=1 Tax=Undibacterium sp. YM2 TaxID=2058625 RepID=UPI001331F253|nr:DUF1501 domain-containing protein [Undibacterium sp. YM2]BBB64301.1 hypothetical protein UNDYM_0048 [Undibacterium sp. YM2]
MKRRDLLKALALLPSTAMLGISSQVMAAPATQNRLLLVFLRGGYDASNLLIPTSSNFYYESRPNIAIARPGSTPDAALALNADWGLHPALRETIYPMFQQGEAAFIPFAGTEDLTRSHFETQDSIEMGQPLNGSRNFHSGFMNRLAKVLGNNGKMTAMSFTDQLPLAMQGSAHIANTALRNVSKNNVDQRQRDLILQMYADTSLSQAVKDGFAMRDEVAREMQEEMNSANRNAISTKGFELEAQRIARLMREKYALGFIDVGGWDTHVNQGGSSGTLAVKFEELGRGLAAYRKEMGDSWRNTTVVVISEFGRTFRENGKHGTDHGHGSVYWVLGGGIKGGQVAGEQIALEAGKLFQNRDYPVLNEYRAVLGGLFGRIYGLNTNQLDQVFAGVKARDLGLA